MSRELVKISVDKEDLERWKRVDDLFFNVWTGVLTKCPECSRQLITCPCARRLASIVLSPAIERMKEGDE